jgi:ankyrin repeat protein
MSVPMSTQTAEFLVACEVHSPARLRAVLDAGFDVRTPIDGVTPTMTLVEMYYRSDAFPACLRLLLDAGGMLDDPRLAPVLLNDVGMLEDALESDPALLHHRTTLRCAFTPLDGATLLHVAAEYGHMDVARLLLERGADVDAAAATDADGLNGQTALFHTVNANANRSAPLMDLLLSFGARTDRRVAGITWGRGFPWATTCFDVTPISYAQLGCLPQFQRAESDIAANVRTMLMAGGRRIPADLNVPNRYLHGA